jgi:type IX secretion system PorP/SprF family membrane protein
MSYQLDAQDLHYSQFDRSPLNINPAFTGLFKGDLRFVGNYRSQWNKVPVSYLTFSGGFDQKFINSNLKNSLFSVGLYLNHDEAGTLELSTTSVYLSGSYTHRLAEKHFLTGGIRLGGSQRRFDASKLQVDSQYNGDTFNGNLDSREVFDDTGIFYADLSGGANYRFQNYDKRLKVDLGYAVFHVNEPNRSFYDDATVTQKARHSIYGLVGFGIGKKVDIGFQAIGQFQGPHEEILVGGNGKLHLTQERDKELSFGLGLSYRLDDAWIPSVVLDYRMWSFGFSYDINASSFNVNTFHRGGPEFSVIYIFSKVRPPKEFEICPIF